jgi:hypothetical protein
MMNPADMRDEGGDVPVGAAGDPSVQVPLGRSGKRFAVPFQGGQVSVSRKPGAQNLVVGHGTTL